MITSFRALLALLFVLCPHALPPVAQAAVKVHFYSREFGNQFPHAFVIVEGTLEATGAPVSGAYGFTATNVSPGILMGSVKGIVKAPEPAYIAKSERRFSITVSDAKYARMMAEIAEWQTRKQPSYNLNKANCVHFVMELADSLGLKVNRASTFLKKPRSFLQEVAGLNPGIG